MHLYPMNKNEAENNLWTLIGLEIDETAKDETKKR